MMDNFFSKRGIPIKLCLFRALVVLSQLRQEVAGHNPVTTEIIIKALYIKSYEARVVIFFFFQLTTLMYSELTTQPILPTIF